MGSFKVLKNTTRPVPKHRARALNPKVHGSLSSALENRSSLNGQGPKALPEAFPLVTERILVLGSYACTALVQGSALGCVQLMHLDERT